MINLLGLFDLVQGGLLIRLAGCNEPTTSQSRANHEPTTRDNPFTLHPSPFNLKIFNLKSPFSCTIQRKAVPLQPQKTDIKQICHYNVV